MKMVVMVEVFIFDYYILIDKEIVDIFIFF